MNRDRRSARALKDSCLNPRPRGFNLRKPREFSRRCTSAADLIFDSTSVLLQEVHRLRVPGTVQVQTIDDENSPFNLAVGFS